MFMKLTPAGVGLLNVFSLPLTAWHNKLECLSLQILFEPSLLFESKAGFQGALPVAQWQNSCLIV